jgi:hypothetical protein
MDITTEKIEEVRSLLLVAADTAPRESWRNFVLRLSDHLEEFLPTINPEALDVYLSDPRKFVEAAIEYAGLYIS